MAHIYKSLTQLVGNTPLLEVSSIEREFALKARLLVKIEAFNPGGSVKDRVALAMINDAEATGQLKPGATIIEPTSGNTGIGLAWAGTSKGYHVILTMPDTMSVERRNLLKAYGADIELTPGNRGMKGAIERARALHESIPDSIILGQFDNPANPDAHYLTTGEEIWRDTDGQIDCFVAGIGTGGTISGVSRALKAHNPDIKTVAVEPDTSAVLSGGTPGPHRIQGIGAGFIPDNYNADFVDSVVTVSYEKARDAARLLASSEGLLAGVSSGAAFSVALDLARDNEWRGRTIVALLPDTGERYLSTPLFWGD